MPLRALKDIKRAISHLNPEEVRNAAERPLNVGLAASSSAAYAHMEAFLAPLEVSHKKRMELMKILHRAGDSGSPEQFDLMLYEQGLPCPEKAFTFYVHDPAKTVRDILKQREDLGMALARNFYPFRKPVVDQIIQAICRENALFSLATALPNIVPSFIEIPWAIGEFASDTAFLTINQIRMAFMIAAASDKPVGYTEQKAEIASIVTSAFGWRAIARELIGKIPLGGGLIPKGAIAYAGTYVVGLSLERYHCIGYGLSRAERRAAYDIAFERGKGIVATLLSGLKGQRVA